MFGTDGQELFNIRSRFLLPAYSHLDFSVIHVLNYDCIGSRHTRSRCPGHDIIDFHQQFVLKASQRFIVWKVHLPTPPVPKPCNHHPYP